MVAGSPYEVVIYRPKKSLFLHRWKERNSSNELSQNPFVQQLIGNFFTMASLPINQADKKADQITGQKPM